MSSRVPPDSAGYPKRNLSVESEQTFTGRMPFLCRIWNTR